MNNGNQFLGTERIGKLMGQYAVPCIISLLVGALYNIVDQIFIANASYLGSYGNAANTVVFPLTVVALAIAVMVGDGCCAFVSMALGRGEMEKAKRSVGNAVVLSVASSLVLTAVYLIFADGIIAMFGGTVNEETFHHSQEYFFYITLGIPFYMFGQAMNPIIRADGNPRFAMISTLAGAVINIILDPIFIFIFQWGMMGAAVATVIGQVATAFLAVWYLLHMKIIKPASGDYALRGSVCGRMLTLGITSFLSQISLVAAMAAINNMLRKYGALDAVFGQEQYAQIPMAVVGIVMKFFQIVISIVVGMAAGCIPIVGYNMGAEKKLRVRELFTRLLMAETLVGAVALMLAEGFPRQLISIFGAANESSYYTDFAIKAFRTYLLHDGAGLRQQGVLYLVFWWPVLSALSPSGFTSRNRCHDLVLCQVRAGQLAHHLAVPHDHQAGAGAQHLVDLRGDEGHALALCGQLQHQLLDFHLGADVNAAGRLIQDQHLALHIHRPGDGHHLLHSDGAAAQLLCGLGRDAQRLQQRSGLSVDLPPVGQSALGTSNVHILRHRQVGAKGDLLIHGADADLLGVLRRADGNGVFVAFHADLAAVLGIHAGQHLDQRGFSRSVFAHQRMDLTLAQRKVHILQGVDAGEVFADAAHFQNCAFLHGRFAPFMNLSDMSGARCGVRDRTAHRFIPFSAEDPAQMP